MSAKFTPMKAQKKTSLAGFARLADGELADLQPSDVLAYVEIGQRAVPTVATRLSARDGLGAAKMRFGIGRGGYRVLPGLYAVGSPTPESPVLVTSNYKLTFDALRKELGGIDAWILVLDTKGVNVWCAAGKKTFGTAELLAKIAETRLAEVVSHNVLVLPQLGATGVSAPEIAKRSRFRVLWGPVLAADIPAFLAAGMKRTEAMKRAPFGLKARMTVSPVEFSQAWPLLLAALALSFLFALPLGQAFAGRLGAIAAALCGSVLIGSFLFPALLPYLPSEAFSAKGAILGAIWGAGAAWLSGASLAGGAALTLACAPASAFVAMGFTGSSTFTSQAGAALEVERGLPLMMASLGASLALGAAVRIFGI